MIDTFYSVIEEVAEEHNVDYIEPTYDDFAEFFDEFDENYEIVDGVAESTVPVDCHKIIPLNSMETR